MSFPRHEYFRRVLCNLLGSEMESGLLPNDEKLIGGMIRNICFDNAVRYFAFPSVQSVVESPVPAFTR
jgi:glucuronate isomerase